MISGLFVGINSYFKSDGENDFSNSLIHPIGDANRLHRVLTSGFKNSDFRLLTDSKYSKIRPTRNNIYLSLNQLLKKQQDGTHLIFYFAGHGSTYNGDILLHPCDFIHDIPDISGIKLNNIIRYLQNSKGKILIILDCCRTAIEDEFFNEKEHIVNFPPLLIDERTYVITACSDNEYSFESYKLGSNGAGIFSYYLSQSFDFFSKKYRVGSENSDLYTIFKLSRERTSLHVAERMGLIQTPKLSGGDANNWIFY